MDAGDKDLILRWADEGILPAFRKLRDVGASMVINNDPGLFVGSVWPSFATGLAADRHGRYCYRQIRSGSYESPRYRVTEIEGEPFWSFLSRAGRRVTIVDVPKTPVCQNLNGIHIVDWGTHDPDLGFATWPPELAVEITADFGNDPLNGRCDYERSAPSDFVALRETLVERVRKRVAIAELLLDRGPWDLFLINFPESHCAGHQFWHLHDVNHDRHSSEVVRIIGNPLKEVYVEIDQAIGRLMECAGQETVICAMTSHGMGPCYEATALLEEILRRLESAGERTSTRLSAGLLMSCWTKLPPKVRSRLTPFRELIQNRLGPTLPALGGPDCQKSFQIPNNDVYGAIRVNLIGREPRGLIQAGAEYRTHCEELRTDLLAFINEETSQPLVKNVLFTDDLYRRKDLDRLPDLLVEWNRDAPIYSIYSPKTGRIRRSYTGNRTGDHKNEGAFFAVGPGIESGSTCDSISMTDIAPTIAGLLDVPLANVDGKAIKSVVTR